MADEKRKRAAGRPAGEASRSKASKKGTTLKVSTAARPDFDHPITAFVYDGHGNLLEQADVTSGRLALASGPEQIARARLYLVPATEALKTTPPGPTRLEALGAYSPVLRAGSSTEPVGLVEIPGSVLDLWPLCLCWVRGRVIRSADSRPVCDARVHVCEVDRLPIWILRLPDPDIFRLRDDLLDALRRPPLPEPPEPGPRPPGPGPDPGPLQRRLIRLPLRAEQPAGAAPRVLEISTKVETVPSVSEDVRIRLQSPSSTVVRTALAQNWELLVPYLCLWPWWWRFRCDEVAVVDTDANGRFGVLVPYDCAGDHPDLYFWVEYDCGEGFETVYRPPIPCWTYWDYPCGTEVTIRVSHPCVRACNDEPDLDGKQVWVVSVGRTVAIGEIHTSGPLEGMVQEPFLSGQDDFAFGGKLEPRVWFGRSALIADGITHYLWSVRPLGAPPSAWSPLDRQVIRHYTTAGGTGPVDVMGPEPGGANAGRFRIRPVAPPPGGIEWLVADEREDLASAHFVTTVPAAPDPMPDCGVEDDDAGKYELKLELFDAAGSLVLWEDHGIALRYVTNEAPIGTDPVQTQVAGSYHRITDSGGKTTAFRMVLHVDNGRCGAAVDAVAGSGLTVDPSCGVVTLTGASPSLDVGFHAGRPNGLAHVSFQTERGLSTAIPAASASGHVSDPSMNGFTLTAPCHFTKPGLSPATLLGSCSQGAFSEYVRVRALTVDGYSRLNGLDAWDVAAFMLTEPCPGSQGQGQGQGRGRGRGGSGGNA